MNLIKDFDTITNNYILNKNEMRCHFIDSEMKWGKIKYGIK